MKPNIDNCIVIVNEDKCTKFIAFAWASAVACRGLCLGLVYSDIDVGLVTSYIVNLCDKFVNILENVGHVLHP